MILVDNFLTYGYVFKFVKVFLNYVPNLLMSASISLSLHITLVSKNYFNFLNFYFISRSSLLRFKSCIDCSVIDFLSAFSRFAIYYSFLSVTYNSRLLLFRSVKLNEKILSLSLIFPSLDWLEREVYDMFGLYFAYHPNLTRILTDYGFQDYPLLKVFPVSGLSELFFSKYANKILYFPVNF